jgi:hypothetical protein
LNNLPPGMYHLAVSEPYNHEDPVLAFNLDVSALSSGQYCVNRTKYPWRQ